MTTEGVLEVEGTTVSYAVAWNVSLNRANPHRMTATCECGVRFVSLACSNKVSRYWESHLRQAFQRHKASGYCRLVTA